MPKFYCDYCDVFLTHDSSSVRKAHNLGRAHQQNVRDYYAGVAAELAEIEELERQVPKAAAETRGLRMPPPMTEPTLSNSGRDKYGIVPTPWMPLPIPYGMPARPGFPNTYQIPADFKPQAPPGVTPPDPTPFIQANMMPGMPGYIPNITSAQALGLIQPPPNLPANFGQLQQDYQQGYRQPQRADGRR